MPETVAIKIDGAQIARLGNMIAAAGAKAGPAIARALNRTGQMTRTQMKRALVGQTGLKSKVINKALKAKSAYAGAARAAVDSYTIRSQGGNIRLKFFKHREAGKGVTASPWNSPRSYPGAFTRVGWKKRVPTTKFHGNVMRRTGAGRFPLQVVKSGLDIPDEMVTGASRAAFFRTAGVLPERMLHELMRVLPS